MEITKNYCDFCKKDLSTKLKSIVEFLLTKEYHNYLEIMRYNTEQIQYDLCSDCYKKVKVYLKSLGAKK